MKKKERAEWVQNILNEYFPHPTIPLHHENSYTLLIAVVLSARSTRRNGQQSNASSLQKGLDSGSNDHTHYR